jgi:HK97 family phage prohead protease
MRETGHWPIGYRNDGRPIYAIRGGSDTAIRPVIRENLIRSVGFEVREGSADDSGDGLTIDGYGAVFNARTTIDSWEGSFQEEIQPGAFKRTLRENTPIMQYDHGRHPLIGSIPLGRWDSAQEDDHGVHVVGRITDNWLMQPVRDAIRDGGVTGMSFRFSVVRENWVDQKGQRIKPEDIEMALWMPDRLGYEVETPLVRQLKEVKAPEIGPVCWPAYQETSVGVRSLQELQTRDDGHTIIIDLGKLDTPSMRATLARAVFLADNAVRQSTDAPQTSTGTADDQPELTDSAPERHQAPVPGEHPSTQVGDVATASRVSKIRSMARSYQSYVLSLDGEQNDGAHAS